LLRRIPSPLVVTSVVSSKIPTALYLGSLSICFHDFPPSLLVYISPPDSWRAAKMALGSGWLQSTAAKSQFRPRPLKGCQLFPPSRVMAHLPSSMKQANRPPPAGSTLMEYPVSHRPPISPLSARATVAPRSE